MTSRLTLLTKHILNQPPNEWRDKVYALASNYENNIICPLDGSALEKGYKTQYLCSTCPIVADHTLYPVIEMVIYGTRNPHLYLPVGEFRKRTPDVHPTDSEGSSW